MSIQQGAYVRRDSLWRHKIEPNGRFKPEAGRYHLYVAMACPWANRCLSMLYLKGLEHAISVSVVHPTWQRTRPHVPGDDHCGWAFASPGDPPKSSPAGYGSISCDECVPDYVNGAAFVRDLYEAALKKEEGTEPGTFSVPVLWCKQEGTIVNNESSEIIGFLNSQFNHLAKNPELDLYPPHLRPQIDAVNEWTYPTINNGVYRCGFARSQEAYEQAFRALFDALDRCESILSTQRFIAGPQLTLADIRLFMTLIRFDPVYVVYFKTNKAFIREYPNLKNYVRDIYQIPEIKRSVNLRQIKEHYFTSHPVLNTFAIIPLGGPAWWEEPHDRERLA